ncbi:MAG TPA: phosphotransferase [Kribbella sp.]
MDSISMQPLAGPALIKPGVVAYWMICGRYAALTEEIRVARTRFRRHQLDWLRMLLSGKKLAEDCYERILAAASSVRKSNACCDFSLGDAALGLAAADYGDRHRVRGLDRVEGGLMRPTEDAIARAFGLATPVAPLKLVQHTSFETWRLNTEAGSYLVKRLWGFEDPVWRPHIERAMSLEAAALACGLPVACPVEPLDAAFGYAARIDDFGTIRVYDWIEHRALQKTDDHSSWLGTVVSALHGLEPLSAADMPEWRWWGVFPRERWENWVQEGTTRGFSWAKPAKELLDFICDVSQLVQETFSAAGDQVLSHGDIEPYNVLISAAGPVLIDWESVACESATLEIGRTALSFGGDDIDQINRTLQAYVDAGGAIANIGEELFLRKVTMELCHITERIGVMLADDASPGWMDGEDLDTKTADELTALPGLLQRLRRLAKACAV